MSFQLPGNNTPSAGAFQFSSPNTSAQPTAAKPGGFTFGTTGGGDAGTKPLGFGFGTVAPTATTAASTTAATATASFGLAPPAGLGATATVATTTAITTQSAVPAFGVSTAASPQPLTTGFGFGPTVGVPSSVASASTVPANTTAAPTTSAASLTSGFSAFASPASTTVASATTTTTPTLLSSSSVTTASTTSATGFASLTTATKTTDSNILPSNASQLSYNQLEEHINKWTLELEEQEKVFTDQATQINAWDKILISNNQKIHDLNDAVQKVKTDQQTLEQELEFIATQHKELEESVVPLQKEFMKIPQVDVERSQTYLMVENLDTQLKQMSEDLKEIIDNLNEANKCQDNSDPIIQIGKILNAHMSSLQWIEQSTSSICNKLEDITKMHETFKRDSERSFRSAYYN